MILTAATALAAETAPLTWEQCVDKVISHPPAELTAANAAVDSANALSRAAEGETWPSLAVNGGYGMLNRRIDTSGVEMGDTETTNGFVFSVSGTWPIYPRLDTDGKIQEAHADTITQKALEDKARSDITFELRTAFYGLIYAQETLPLASMIVDRISGISQHCSASV